MRMYEPAWITLKQLGTVSIAAHPKLHARIYKAVIKEKDMDLVYKLEVSEDCARAKLSKKSVGGVLTITLHKSIGLSDL